MLQIKHGLYMTIIIFISFFCFCSTYANAVDNVQEEVRKKIIKNIDIAGNKIVTTDTILGKIPYKIGEPFDPKKSRTLINNLYMMKAFKTIQVKTDKETDSEIVLLITVEEKTHITDLLLSGNKNFKQEDIEKKIKLSDIRMIDEGDIHIIIEHLKKLYAEKNYHSVDIEYAFKNESGNNILMFTINEGQQTKIKRILFTGNKHFSSKILRKLLFTQEDWILGFLNKAGNFHPDALDYDKNLIENFYHNEGFLTAHITDIATTTPDQKGNIIVTFHINEGDLYTIHSVKAQGTSLFSQDEIKSIISIQPGELYCKDKIRACIESIRLLFGEYGYIYVEVDPAITPNESTKEVSIIFHIRPGSCMKLRRLSVIGNKKTREEIIRRNILFDETELVTTKKLDLSKEKVQALGYFDPRNGVNWKITKINDDSVDLELFLQEKKTGQFYAMMGTGGILMDQSSPSESFRVSVGACDINFLGYGWRYNLNASYSRQDRSLDFSLANPWLFGRPLYGSINVFHKKSIYEEFHGTHPIPEDLSTGAIGQIGCVLSATHNINLIFDAGIERIKFNHVIASVNSFQPLYDVKFRSGNLLRFGSTFIQDVRNHPLMPNRGSLLTWSSKIAVPHEKERFGFIKCELDFQWYTPLIDEYDLIFKAHTFFGFIKEMHRHTIPYRELFHIGGPATVRGFLFGQIGPLLIDEMNDIHNSLGAKKAFITNLELFFPITPDNSIRGVIFYDGGAGWDTPNKSLIPSGLRNNNFDFRHAIGFGIRLTKPSAVRIDFGFKLDRRKKRDESLSEIHFTMAQDF